MELLERTNKWTEKWIFLIMPCLILLGIIGGELLVSWTNLTPYLFMLLTFISSLNVDYRSFGKLLRKPILLLLFLIAVQIVIPWIVFYAASQIFSGEQEFITGITLLVLLPMGVTSIFWTAYNKGNVETVIAVVTMNTLLSPFIVPIAFSLILGSQISLDAQSLVYSLIKLVLIPTGLGLLVGEWLKRRETAARYKIGASFTGKLCLYVIVLLNAASISEHLDAISQNVARLVLTILIVMLLGYIISYVIGKFMYADRSRRVAITYAGGVRNYTVGIVLASSFFTPIVSVPILIAMLFQHPLALMMYYALNIKPKRASEQ